jgi:exopolysaccharide biosynthesis polyprenyl glycosylphosphotransferase
MALLGVLGAAWVVGLAGSRTINSRIHRSLLGDLPLILNRVLLISIVVALAVSLAALNPDRASLVLVATTLGVVVVPLMRGLAYALLTYRAEGVKQRVIIIGAGRIGTQVAHLLSQSHQREAEVVGFLDKNPLAGSRHEEEGLPVLGSSYDLPDVLQEYEVDKAIIAFSTAPHQRVLEIIWECDRQGVDVSIVPRFFEAATVQSSIENVSGVPLMHLNRARLKGFNGLLKRAFDFAATTAGLLVIWPVLLVLALAIKLDSPGPVIFSQKRAGYDGKVFTMYKFRSMKVGAQKMSNYTVFGDPRRTRVGKYLRAFSLDELPQLINVLKGDMSLVGPRPEVWDRSQELAETVYRYHHRYRVKSGITGWAQVNGLRGDTSIEERVLYDNYYIENWSLWLDIKTILLTLFKALISEPERNISAQNRT